MPAGLAEPGEPPDTEDPLDVLQECIQQVSKTISALPDPKDTQDAVKALGLLAGIQTRLMTQTQGPGGPPQGQ